ncbi:MAG TPA: helix-turn-helix domain-containing protein, partial [Lachnospiraceae bacterium]|nr:helix-turn-helix domain-containing protein [Lachnospiraceae bacterium]
HDITKGKWKPIILWLLGYEKQSLSMLKNGIKGISQKMLIEQLKELIDNGLVGKNSFDGYPLKVEYFLTKRGEKMLEAIRIMQGIGIEMMIEDGRSDFLKEKGLL